jgi:hypothetical protein
MQNFELNKLTRYDKDSVIQEIRRVAALIPGKRLSRTQFDQLSKVHSSTLHNKFGSWREALIAAGLGERFDDSSESWNSDEIVQKLQSLARQLGRRTITQREFNEHTGIGQRPLKRLFGSYGRALEAAGLTQSPAGRRYTDDECFENLLSVWTNYGRQPNLNEMKVAPSCVGPKAYVLRWGSWRNALQAFVDRVNRDNENGPTTARPTEDNKDSAGKTETTKRINEEDRHEIKLGLRYRVLVRDRFRCVLCGASPATILGCKLHVDHILPWSKGGKTVSENLRTLCEECNLGKGNKIEPE